MKELGLLYAAAAWGSTFVLIKMALPYVDPFALIEYRFLLAALLMGCLLRWWGRSPWTDWKKGWALGWRVWLCYVPQVVGLEFTSATNSGFITGLYIAFVPWVAWWEAGKRPAPIDLVAIGVSLTGLWILTNGIQHLNRGDAITLLTAFAYALWLVRSDRYAKEGTDAAVITFQQFMWVVVLTLPISLMRGASWHVETTHTWTILAFLAVFATVSTHLVQMWGQRTVAPVKVALILSLEPVFSALLAWTWGGETFVWRQAWGGALIVAALILPDIPGFGAWKSPDPSPLNVGK